MSGLFDTGTSFIDKGKPGVSVVAVNAPWHFDHKGNNQCPPNPDLNPFLTCIYNIYTDDCTDTCERALKASTELAVEPSAQSYSHR